MDAHENAMLTFIRTWHLYGGSDDQILPEFGISEPTFYQRVLALLARPRTVGLGDEERKALITFCMAKLREYGYPQRDRPGMTRQRAIRHS